MGSIGTKPVLSTAPAISAMRPAFCGRNDVGDLR